MHTSGNCTLNGTLVGGTSCTVDCASGYTSTSGSASFVCDENGSLTNTPSLLCQRSTTCDAENGKSFVCNAISETVKFGQMCMLPNGNCTAAVCCQPAVLSPTVPPTLCSAYSCTSSSSTLVQNMQANAQGTVCNSTLNGDCDSKCCVTATICKQYNCAAISSNSLSNKPSAIDLLCNPSLTNECSSTCCIANAASPSTIGCSQFNCASVSMAQNTATLTNTCDSAVPGNCALSCCSTDTSKATCSSYDCGKNDLVANITASTLTCDPSATECRTLCCQISRSPPATACSVFTCPSGYSAKPGTQSQTCRTDDSFGCISTCCLRTTLNRCPPLTPNTNQKGCGSTAVGSSCIVSCATNYYGDNTLYDCKVINGKPTYVLRGRANTCRPMPLCSAFQCTAPSTKRQGLPPTARCTTTSNCKTICCASKPLPTQTCSGQPIPNVTTCPTTKIGGTCSTKCTTGYTRAETTVVYKCTPQYQTGSGGSVAPKWVQVTNCVATCQRKSSN